MNPLTINPLAMLGAGAIALAVGFGSGWTVNGWRLDGDHQRALAVKQGEYDALAAAVREQNRAVDAMKAATDAADGRRKLAETYAAGIIGRIGARAEGVAASKAPNCDGVLREAWGNWQ